MQIRPTTRNDADAISALIKSVAHAFTLQPQGQGTEGFLQEVEPAGTAGRRVVEGLGVSLSGGDENAVLLGQSFLSRFDITIGQNQMVLRAR